MFYSFFITVISYSYYTLILFSVFELAFVGSSAIGSIIYCILNLGAKWVLIPGHNFAAASSSFLKILTQKIFLVYIERVFSSFYSQAVEGRAWYWSLLESYSCNVFLSLYNTEKQHKNQSEAKKNHSMSYYTEDFSVTDLRGYRYFKTIIASSVDVHSIGIYAWVVCIHAFLYYHLPFYFLYNPFTHK